MNTNKTLFTATLILALLSPKAGKLQTVDTALAQTYRAFESAKSYPQMLEASNIFKLIATKYPSNWLADYYAAWSIATLSFKCPKKADKDPMLDEAEAYFKKIEYMDSTNDEVAVLGALVAQARLSVAPMSRHGKYGAIANKYFDMVKKINPNNPRMYYLKGNALFYTPELFGGGSKKALPYYQKAEALFANDSSNICKPHWGKKENEYKMEQCKLQNK